VNGAGMKVFGKSPVGAFLRVNQSIWNRLPPEAIEHRSLRACGRAVHTLVRRWATRRHYTGTFFLRNRPQLELICRLADHRDSPSVLQIAVLGCSTGAEVYSIVAALRSARPVIEFAIHAVDISPAVVAVARQGSYLRTAPGSADATIFDRLTPAECEAMFEEDAEQLRVRSWIKERVAWHVGDAADPAIAALIGPQDIVVANNFLCHMSPRDAERCLRKIVRLVSPGGYLIVSGVDLDVRARVAADLGWQPVTDLLEDIHDGDAAVRRDWPAQYWGLEPLNKRRRDWRVRYATAFRVTGAAEGGQTPFAGLGSDPGQTPTSARTIARQV
jgi:SAM-dependent methyltransferase